MGAFRKTAKRWLPPVVTDFLKYSLKRDTDKAPDADLPKIPDADLYNPRFSPWLGLEPFAEVYERAKVVSLVSADRCWVLYTLAQQAMTLRGNVWETGVYRGGTASLLRDVIKLFGNGQSLHLFDTFEGMPKTDPVRDWHKQGDFSDTSLEGVRSTVGALPWIHYHKGYVPATFVGLDAELVAFAHIDVDIYQSVLDSCEFIYPRLVEGGFIVFDDYGFATCPGARQAVDEFFSTKPERPLVLSTGQAVIFKSPV